MEINEPNLNEWTNLLNENVNESVIQLCKTIASKLIISLIRDAVMFAHLDKVFILIINF